MRYRAKAARVRALAQHPAPEIHHSDQGVQYAATAYTQVLRDVNVQISMATVGEAWQNGYAERLMRTIKVEDALHPQAGPPNKEFPWEIPTCTKAQGLAAG